MIAHVNGVNLYYEKTGTKEPLILLHGNGESHNIFDKAIPVLSQYYTVYAIDTRGHGESTKVENYHYSEMTEDIKCFIEALHLHNPILYGFSDGGIIGLLLAIQYPKLLSGLVISGANVSPDGIGKGWMTLFKIMYVLTRDARLKMMFQEPDITYEMLQTIAIPTTVLAGSRDMIKRNHTEYIANSIKNSSLTILQGEGHGSYIVHSKRIAEVILEHLKP